MLRFEWDRVKRATNLLKHGVSFEEAASVFLDPLAVTFYDKEASCDEFRERTYGFSEKTHLLVVIHTQRHANIRIISARRATHREKKIYVEG